MPLPQREEPGDREPQNNQKPSGSVIYLNPPTKQPYPVDMGLQPTQTSPQRNDLFYPICASIHGHAVSATAIEHVVQMSTTCRDGLMEGVIAACALVAHADGKVDDTERRRVNEIMRALPDFADFTTQNVVEEFARNELAFALDPSGARSQVLKAAAALRGDPANAGLLLCACQNVLEADGIHHRAEYHALHELGRAVSAV